MQSSTSIDKRSLQKTTVRSTCINLSMWGAIERATTRQGTAFRVSMWGAIERATTRQGTAFRVVGASYANYKSEGGFVATKFTNIKWGYQTPRAVTSGSSMRPSPNSPKKRTLSRFAARTA